RMHAAPRSGPPGAAAERPLCRGFRRWWRGGHRLTPTVGIPTRLHPPAEVAQDDSGLALASAGECGYQPLFLASQAMNALRNPANQVLLGILLMLGGDFMFSLNDAMGKWLVATLSVGQVLLVRSVGAFAVLGPMMA